MPIVQARIQGNSVGEKVVNVLHVSTPDDNLAAAAVALRDAWKLNIVPKLSDKYSFEGVEVRPLTAGAGGVFSGVTSLTAGAVAGAVMPTWACVSIGLFTSDASRSGRGRVGLAPIGEGATEATNGNLLTPAALAEYVAAFTAFEADIANGGAGPSLILQVVSRFKNKAERPTPVSLPVTSFKVNSIVGSRLSRHPNR